MEKPPAALASLLGRDAWGAIKPGRQSVPGLPALPHFAPKAKNVIYLFMAVGPSQLELFDYKPKLRELHGKSVPDGYVTGKRFSTMTGKADGKLLLAPVEPFHQRGQSGAWVSDLFPCLGAMADDLCILRGLHTNEINHAPAQMFLHTLQGHTGIHQIINQQNTPGERTRSGGDAMGDIQLTALCAGSLTVRARGENGQRYLEEAREYIARTQPASGKTQRLIELPS